MISAHSIFLFVHLTSIAVLAIAMGVSHRGTVLMEKATTREAALQNCKLIIDNSIIFPTSTIFIIGSGLYMTMTMWTITAPWVIVSLSFVVVSTILGFVVMYPRMGRLYGRLASQPDGPLDAETAAHCRDPVVIMLPTALSGNALGTAFVMVSKPSWGIAIGAIVGFTVLAIIPVWSRTTQAIDNMKRARDLARTKRESDRTGRSGVPILCDVLDPKLVVVETVSPFTLKAHKALKAAGIEYVTRRSTMSSDFRHLNPKGQIPILIVDGQIINGSREIVRFCAKRAPDVFEDEATASPERTAENHFWEEYAESTLKGIVAYSRWAEDENWERAKAAYFVDMPSVLKPIVIPNIRKAVLRVIKSSDVGRGSQEEEWARYLAILDALEVRAPADGFWLGTKKLMPCDISLYAFLQCQRTSITPNYHEALIARTKLSAYMDRVEALTKRRPEAATRLGGPVSATVETAGKLKDAV